MTLRHTLGFHANRVHEQIDEVLDGEDGIIILVGPRQATSYCLGFGLFGCQLELLALKSSVPSAPSRRLAQPVKGDMFMTNKGLIFTMALMPILAASTAGIGGVWLTGGLKMFGLLWLAAIVGVGLLGYFRWRARLLRQIVNETEDERRAA